MPWDMDALIGRVVFGSADCIVIGFGVKSAKRWRFITCNPRHFTEPQCELRLCGIYLLFDVCQKMIVVALQTLVVTGFAAKVKYKLSGAHSCYCGPNGALRDINSKALQKIAHSRCP